MSTILITGAGTGIGRLAARTLAARGHHVSASMREPEGRNQVKAADLRNCGRGNGYDLDVVELDVLSEESAHAAVDKIVQATGRLDVVVRNAVHLLYGITKAFTPDQVLAAFNTNTVGALRVNRAALPVMRKQGSGLLLWVGSGTSFVVPPFLAPYTAAKAALDSFAESVSVEVARFGIETSILMPGPFTQGTAHFPMPASPATKKSPSDTRSCTGSRSHGTRKQPSRCSRPASCRDVQAVADEIARIVDLPHGQRPYRSSVDFSDFGDVPVASVAEAQRTRLLTRMGLADTLSPAHLAASKSAG